MANTIDERLLAAQLADQQRQARTAEEDKERQGQMAKEDQERQAGEPAGGGSGSLRERWRAAKQALDLKQRAKDKIEEKVAAPAKAGTSKALRWAWMTLIPSFGLSLIYINIHVFLKAVVGEKLFCKLGEEWIPQQIAGAGGEAGKNVGKIIGIVEVIILAALDLAALLIIMSVLGLLVMIADFMQAGFLKQIAGFVGGLTKIGWSGIKALFSIFAK